MDKPEVLIFGAGEITNLLIKNLALRNKKISCITDNAFGQNDAFSHPNLEILSYREIVNRDVDVDTAIFSWRDASRIKDRSDALYKWLESTRFQAKNTFHLSSASIYKQSIYPQLESSTALDANEKLELEKKLHEIAAAKNLHHTNLRISNVYGLSITYGFIGSLFSAIRDGGNVRVFNDQNLIRDYIYVNDVIYAIEKLLEIKSHDSIINISTGKGTSVAQILEIFASHGYDFKKQFTSTIDTNVKTSSILSCKILSELVEWRPKGIFEALNEMLPIN